ncbi:MAG: sensor histidine kinase [Acidimicrobiales bacterium]
MTSAGTMITGAHRTQEWLRARPLLIDALFAGLMGLLALADLSGDAVGEPARDADLLAIALVVVGAASLTLRRVAPVAVFWFIIAISCVFYARDYGSFMAAVGLAGIYAVAVHAGNRRTAWISLAAGSLLLVGVASLTLLDASDGYRWAAALSMTTSIGATILAGTVIRNKDEIFADTKQRAERAEADRKIEAEQAVAKERLRIAREMHDVVAHGMSLMTVQAAAAQEVVETRPDDAARLMHSVETTGRDALAEMRRMLGVLRNDEPADGAAGPEQLVPQPSLGDLDTIITHCTEAGTPTELTISGDQRPLAPGIELAAYRTVQEALTNVVKHGGDAATAAVDLHYGVDTLHIEISDTGRGAVSSLSRSGSDFDLNHGHGHGLIGMRERIEIYDGQVAAGPQPGGGYAVNASLPIKPRSDPPAVASKDSETVA